MRRPHTWALWGAWGLAVCGAFVVFVSGGCGLLRRMTQGEPHRSHYSPAKDAEAAADR